MKYISDHYHGFRAEVTYQGVAHYPPPSKYGSPFVVKPSYQRRNQGYKSRFASSFEPEQNRGEQHSREGLRGLQGESNEDSESLEM